MRWTLQIAILILALIPRLAAGQVDLMVTVLVPDRFQIEEELALELYEALVEAISQHDDYVVADIPPQSYGELQSAVGCPEDRVECLGILGPILETGYILWGEIGASGQAYLVELTLWDFVAGEEVFHFTKAIEGDLDTFRQLLPVLARGAVHGRVGAVEIELNPADAQLEFDSRPIDGGEVIQLTRLELGPHVVRAQAEGYFSHSQEIIVDTEPLFVSIELVPEHQEIGVSSGRLWSWVSIGTGVTLTGVGVAFGLMEQSTQESFDEQASRTTVDITALNRLQSDGEQEALLANLFIGSGVVAILTGVILFFLEDEGAVSEESTTEAGLDFSFGRHGAGLSFDIEF